MRFSFDNIFTNSYFINSAITKYLFMREKTLKRITYGQV